jgi:hypothetical protein
MIGRRFCRNDADGLSARLPGWSVARPPHIGTKDEMKVSKVVVCGMVLLDSLLFWIKGATATDHGTRTSFRRPINTVSALAHASLNTPVNESDPDVGITREDVLKVYPSNFIVDWDDVPATLVATFIYQCCGRVATTTCEITESDVDCWCMKTNVGMSFEGIELIPVQDLNTPVQASGPDPDAVPTIDDVAAIYPIWGFLVDWMAGHDGTVAAGILFGACGTLPTTCILEDERLECFCRGFASPVFLGYETLRPPDAAELEE